MTIEDLEQRIGTPPGDQAFRLTSANKELVREWLVAKGFDAARASVVRENTLLRAYTIPRYLHEMLTRGDYNSSVARKPWGRTATKPEPKAPEPHYCNGCGWEILVGETRCNNPNCPGDQPIPAPDRPKCPQCGAVHDDCEHSLCHKCRTAPTAEPLNLGAYTVPTPKEPTPMPTANGHATPKMFDLPEHAPPTPDTFDALQMLSRGIQAIAGQAINEDRVIALIQEHAPVRETVRETIIVKAGDATRELPDELRHEKFPEVLAAMLANIPVMLVGPAGTGKTTLGKQLAATMERPFGHIGAVTSRFELSGFVDAHGNYQATSFFHAYTEGHVFLFDEIDGSDPAALLWCNTAIANGFCAFPHGEFERHPDFRLIAAANTYGHGQDRVYAGRNQLDGASLDRFVVVDFDYDEKLERALFGDTHWTTTVQTTRKAVADLKLRHVVSTRAIDYGRRLIEAGLPQSRVETMTLWKGMDSATIAKVQNRVLGAF